MTAEANKSCDFLWFGFVPDLMAAKSEIERVYGFLKDDSIRRVNPEDFKALRELWIQVVSDAVAGESEIGLGLSAGLDSRAILGALLEIMPAKMISSYTYGQPGSSDWEGVRGIVSKLLPRHEYRDVDGNSYRWDVEEAVAKVKRRPDGVVLGVGSLGTSRLGSFGFRDGGVRIITGFMGDSLSGKKLPEPIPLSWSESQRLFVQRNQAHKGTLSLFPQWYDPLGSIYSRPLAPTRSISDFDQLDWGYRQSQRIFFHVGSGNRITPFTDPRWWKSMGSLSLGRRKKQALYREFLVSEFPKVFSNKDRRAPVARAAPRGNYQVNFDQLFEQNSSFREFVLNSISDLEKRQVLSWLDLRGIVAHLRKSAAGLGRQAYALASLEVNFKAGRLSS